MKSIVPLSRIRVLAWTIAVSLAFGFLGIGEPAELVLRTVGNTVTSRPASGQIAVVGFDDKSLAEHGRFPWPRRDVAKIIDQLNELGAARIFIDGDISYATNPADDLQLRDALARSPTKVTVATRFVDDEVSGKRRFQSPAPLFQHHVNIADINVQYNFWGMIRELPFSMAVNNRTVPSLSTAIANRYSNRPGAYPIDFSFDIKSIPFISAVDLLNHKVSANRVRNKTVVLGTASSTIGDIYIMPRYGQVSGVFFHVMGAETLRLGLPLDISWLVPLALATVAALFVATLRSTRSILIITTGVILPLLIAEVGLQHWLIFIEVTPAVALLALAGGRLSWLNFRDSYRVRGTINAISGLPNLKALRDLEIEGERALVVARIQNFAEITSALMPEKEKLLVDQIVKRLTVGAPSTQLYQGEEGSFAWLTEVDFADAIEDHLSALHSLFRQPLVLDSEQIDLVINFGVDRDSSRSVSNRLGSALVAVEEAAAEGVNWKDYDPAKLKDASWKLSLLGQLDAAINAGDLWVAYQPKIDLANRCIVGAEALARWTHPEKGEISPDLFIRAAEQGNRMDKLTLHVLNEALAATSAICETGTEFDIAVNLSARLIEDPTLVTAIVALLDQHGVDPRQLTLEITETAALGQTPGSLATLHQIRTLGIGLSIDDYGTGMSTLDYLRRIPATQIKIDRCFIDAIDRGGGDLVMVNSTIQLAHSLGLEVVAEGVERQRTLELLTDLGCDTAQGYLIGRPIPLKSLMDQLTRHGRRSNPSQMRL